MGMRLHGGVRCSCRDEGGGGPGITLSLFTKRGWWSSVVMGLFGMAPIAFRLFLSVLSAAFYTFSYFTSDFISC